MKKFLFFLGFLGFSALISFTPVHAKKDLDIAIKYFSCDTHGKFLVRFGVINTRNYARMNTHIAFKILRGDKIVGCNEVALGDIPANSHGSKVYTVTIDGECDREGAVLKSWIFQQSGGSYMIDDWLSGCP